MVIRKLNHNTYDVFGNTGWDSWTRVRKFLWGYKLIAGAKVDHALFRTITEAINAHPQGNIDNI